MKPGGELDGLVAEKVMGQTRCDQWEPVNFGSAGGFMMIKGKCGHENCIPWGDEYAQRFAPKYSTDIAAAWKVVEKMGVTFSGLNLLGSRGDRWQCGWLHDDNVPRTVEADTAPHAICLAALKAVGAA